METRIEFLEKAHSECQEHHLQCERKVGEFVGRLDELRQQVQMMVPHQGGSGVSILMQGGKGSEPTAVIESDQGTDPDKYDR